MFSKIVKGAVVSAALALAMGQFPAFAGQQDFEIVNKTGYPIKDIRVSEANNDSWEEDVLGRDILNDGESFELEFAGNQNVCKWDMKVVYDDGEEAVWKALNLCQISKLTLRWNKNTGVTSAAID